MIVESRFNNHLDECNQCRNNPFALCLIGENLLRSETVDLSKPLKIIQLLPLPRKRVETKEDATSSGG